MTTEVQLGYTVCLGVGLVLHAIGCGEVWQLRQRGHNTICRLVFHLPLHLSSTKPVLVAYTYGQLKSHELCLCQLYRKKKYWRKARLERSLLRYTGLTLQLQLAYLLCPMITFAVRRAHCMNTLCTCVVV